MGEPLKATNVCVCARCSPFPWGPHTADERSRCRDSPAGPPPLPGRRYGQSGRSARQWAGACGWWPENDLWSTGERMREREKERRREKKFNKREKWCQIHVDNIAELIIFWLQLSIRRLLPLFRHVVHSPSYQATTSCLLGGLTKGLPQKSIFVYWSCLVITLYLSSISTALQKPARGQLIACSNTSHHADPVIKRL